MPLIQVRVIEGVFTKAQKRLIIHKLTDAMVSIEGEHMRSVTLVIVEEVKSGDWGIGGRSLSTVDVKAMAAGTPAGKEPGPNQVLQQVGHAMHGSRSSVPLPA